MKLIAIIAATLASSTSLAGISTIDPADLATEYSPIAVLIGIAIYVAIWIKSKPERDAKRARLDAMVRARETPDDADAARTNLIKRFNPAIPVEKTAIDALSRLPTNPSKYMDPADPVDSAIFNALTAVIAARTAGQSPANAEQATEQALARTRAALKDAQDAP